MLWCGTLPPHRTRRPGTRRMVTAALVVREKRPARRRYYSGSAGRSHGALLSLSRPQTRPEYTGGR